jgi:hypothetical protein
MEVGFLRHFRLYEWNGAVNCMGIVRQETALSDRVLLPRWLVSSSFLHVCSGTDSVRPYHQPLKAGTRSEGAAQMQRFEHGLLWAQNHALGAC